MPVAVLLIASLLSADETALAPQLQQSVQVDEDVELLRLRKDNASMKAQIEAIHRRQEQTAPVVAKVEQLDAKVNAPVPAWYERWETYIIALLSGGGGRGMQLLLRAKRTGWLIYAKIQAMEAATRTLVPTTELMAAQIENLIDAATLASQKPYNPDKIVHAFEAGAASLNKIKSAACEIKEAAQAIIDAGRDR